MVFESYGFVRRSCKFGCDRSSKVLNVVFVLNACCRLSSDIFPVRTYFTFNLHMGLSGVWFSQLMAFILVKCSDCLEQLNCSVVTEDRWCLNHVVVFR